MIMAPIPSDRVKKECPTASRIASRLIGPALKRKRSASSKPAKRVAARQRMPRIANRIGMSTRVTFSMPRRMPRTTTAMVAPMKRAWKAICKGALAKNRPKAEPRLSAISLPIPCRDQERQRPK